MSATTKLKELLEGHTRESAPELVCSEKDQALRCLACGHRCFIREGRAGVCRVRFNQNGALRVPGGYVSGLQSDPIEKKPFFHAYPGHNALSFGMLGCDLHCSFCQNWVSSQALRDDEAIALPSICDSDDLVRLALEHRVPVLVSTYNEPLITADWAAEIFEKAVEAGLACGFVSNGNATPEVLEYLRPFVSLYKVDLKGFNDKRYRELGAVLSTILRSIEKLKEMGYWVEIVTLVIPDFNDSDGELRDIAEFIASVSVDIPWHATAFHPDYKMTGPSATRVETLERAHELGKEAGLRYVYAGNLPGAVGGLENTQCPSCSSLLIERRGFTIIDNRMKGSQCPACHTEIAGVWEANPPRKSQGGGFPRPVRI